MCLFFLIIKIFISFHKIHFKLNRTLFKHPCLVDQFLFITRGAATMIYFQKAMPYITLALYAFRMIVTNNKTLFHFCSFFQPIKFLIRLSLCLISSILFSVIISMLIIPDSSYYHSIFVFIAILSSPLNFYFLLHSNSIDFGLLDIVELTIFFSIEVCSLIKQI